MLLSTLSTMLLRSSRLYPWLSLEENGHETDDDDGDDDEDDGDDYYHAFNRNLIQPIMY